MTSIYTITGIPASYGERHDAFPNTFGWWPTLEAAREYVQRDTTGDMVECLFTYLVIEEVASGRYGLHPEKAWYRWEGQPLEGRWVECERPAFATGIVNWAF